MLAIPVLIIIATLFYAGYQRKRNVSLQHVVKDNKDLLKEKEWLLKEVHHRVKNNLQTMISLINIQSAYLKNEQAVEAIRNSARRMVAISLIHQKIYQSDNLSCIDMPLYISELAAYLQESFSAEDRINYTIHADPLDLDITQAVPLGLILNEAITNAIKYAFPDERQGEISILIQHIGNDHYILTISDNGIGLPLGFDPTGEQSLGMLLIQGLTRQIQGQCKIESPAGTVSSERTAAGVTPSSTGTSISITFRNLAKFLL